MISIQGKGVSSGVGVGPLYFYHRTKTEIPRYTVTDPDAEWHRFKGAQTAAIEQLGELAEKARAEAGDELTREALGQNERDGADDRLAEQELCKEFTHARLFPRAHVVTYDGNAARRHADDDGNDDLEKLHHDSDDCHWDLRILRLRENFIQRAVFAEHIVDRRHCRNEGDLREKARYAEPQRPAADRAIEPEILLGELHDLHVTQIPHREHCCDGLPDDGRDGGSHHAPTEAEDENGV